MSYDVKYIQLAEVPDITQKNSLLHAWHDRKRCSYDFLWSTDVRCYKMCLDFFLWSIFLFWYFDITVLIILWWTILPHIWAESNFFDTHRKTDFDLRSESCFPVPSQSTSWFYCGSVQLRLHLSKIRKNVSSLVFHELGRTSLTLPSVALYSSPPSSVSKDIPQKVWWR